MGMTRLRIQASGLTNYFEMNSNAYKFTHILNMKIRPFLVVRDPYLNMFQAAVYGSV